MLPHDLRNYKAPSAFDLIGEEAAGYVLFALLFAVWIADRMGWLA